MDIIDSDLHIILLLMVKNESKIITRVLESALQYVDAVCIADTGSTDSTVNIASEFLTDRKIPFRIVHHIWKHFGHNRSLSFTACKEFCDYLQWDPMSSWALALDGDMCIKPTSNWSRKLLVSNGHSIIQISGSLEYFNTRFLRIGFPWKCTGATHEYWDGDTAHEIKKEYIFIDDIGDGGAKADKFERDIRLLTESLKDEPTNTRTHFYLAQSYHCINNNEKALEYYKKRIELGGWFEEVWYSKYMIVKTLFELGRPFEAEEYGNSAIKQIPHRTEVSYTLAKYFREKGDNYKAYHYYLKGKDYKKPDSGLFVETDVYNYLFHYERTILDYYVNSTDKTGSLVRLVEYLNIPGRAYYNNGMSNMQFYVSPICTSENTKEYNCPQIGDYIASSPSIVILKNGIHVMNIRYVNYSVQIDGGYEFRDPDGHCRTKNTFVYLDKNLQIMSRYYWMPETVNNLQICDTTVHGHEDVRIFEHVGDIMYIACSREYTKEVRVIMGKYDIDTRELTDTVVLQPPTFTECEKNWIPVPSTDNIGELRFIYNWHPLQIGTLDISNKLNIIKSYSTPEFFTDVRGSSTGFMHGNEIWFTVHKVYYANPRFYYHFIVILDMETLQLKRYSMPFVFKGNGIEYCLSMIISANERLSFVFSKNDCNPCIVQLPIKSFIFVDV